MGGFFSALIVLQPRRDSGTLNSKRERPKVPLRGTKSHKKITVPFVPIGGKPHPGFAVGPAEHCQPPRAQTLPTLLLWGGDSKAVVFCATPGHGESAPLLRSRDRLRNLFPDSLLACSVRSPASRDKYATD